LTDALEWIARQQGVRILLHYLDDFITVGPPDSPVCGYNMQKLCETCAELGVPVATAKTVDPTTCLTFLGMEVDTDRLELCLPQEKLQRVKQMVQEWMGCKAARRRELEPLLGLLQHVAKVVSPGKRFVRRIIQTLTGVRQHDHYVRLGAEIRSDLAWWHRFLDKWNGVGILPTPGMESVHIHSDASGSWSCAAVWDKQWLQWRWNERAQDWHIAPKKLLPIVLAGMVWGSEWKDKRVCCHCDNLSVVEVLNNGYSKDATLMHLLRSLFFISEHYQFLVDAVHISGKENGQADALSRNLVSSFFQMVPRTVQQSAQVPKEALQLLVEDQPDWTSQHWMELFAACIRQAWHPQPRKPTWRARGGIWTLVNRVDCSHYQ